MLRSRVMPSFAYTWSHCSSEQCVAKLVRGVLLLYILVVSSALAIGSCKAAT